MTLACHKRSQEIWDEIGEWWDQNIEDGDSFHRTFIFPWVREQLNHLPQAFRVLDLGCGNGALLRYLYKESSYFLGVDFSKSLLEKAKQRNCHKNVEFIYGDLTDTGLFENLANEKRWDFIISSMTLHDCSNINVLASSIKNLLNPHGQFVFSIPHPFFNSAYTTVRRDQETNKPYVEITGYNTQKEFLSNGKPQQPQPHYYFHRTLESMLNIFLKEGLVVSGIKEGSILEISESHLPKNKELEEQFREFPPVLLCKFTIFDTSSR